MKLYNITILIFLFFSSSLIFAQQDYQIVQNFQNKYSEIQQSIKNADSLAQLNRIQVKLDNLKSNFQEHKELLDKSLYPNNFESMIEKINNELKTRKEDFAQIKTLTTQVSQLESQVTLLNSKNSMLIDSVEKLDMLGQQNKENLKRLQNNIAELRLSLMKRDRLVMTMLDSLMPPSGKEETRLTKKEKEEIYSEAQKTNVISNVLRSINDNIKFLEVTNLSPDDLSAIKKQQKEFEQMWKNVGPRVLDIYSEKGQSTKNLKAVDDAFTRWNKAIAQGAWFSIRKNFTDQGIILNKFSDGTEFTNTLTSFANDEIKNAEMKGEKAEKTYKVFVDTVWFGQVKPTWVPYLVDNDMFSITQKDTVEKKFAQWNNAVMPGSYTWVYIVILIVIIVLIIIFVRSKTSKNKTSQEV